MLQSNEMTARCARSSTEAMTGYANAAVAAYTDLAMRTFNAWAVAFEAMTPKPEPTSWYRHPDHPGRNANPFASFLPPAFASAAAPWAGFGPVGTQAFNPFAFWARAWPMEGNVASWPLAFALIGWGVPRSVAYPLAGANTAAMDAMASAGQAIDGTFATFAAYRTDGGHASTQVRVGTPKAAAELPLPPAWQLFAPWLQMMDANARG